MPDGAARPFPASVKQYNLVRLIGQGGMGFVVEGQDRRDGSRVAVKLLFPHLAASDPSFTERFEREAHVAALLRSPYTVHLLDFGVESGQYFLVMEYIDGEPLSRRIQRGPLAADEALRIASEMARALEEAGARGIVHRDIKPDNVLIDSDGRVKVTDFGIARSTNAPGLTVAGGFVGTPAYAAPEQADGEADQRSDIYSLGVTLYAMLTGRVPYEGRSTMDILIQHRTAPLPMGPLSHLPDPVQNVVRRCLEKDPLDRYQNATELAGAIDRARRATRAGGAAVRSGGTPPAPLAAAAQPAGAGAGSVEPSPPAVPAGPDTAATVVSRPPAPPSAPPPAAPGPQTGSAAPEPPPLAAAHGPGARPPGATGDSGGRGGRGGGRRSILLGAVGGAVAIAALVIALVIAGGGDGDPPADAGSPTATATATVTGTVTQAGGATLSPAATATPTATPTPSPTATPTPQGGWARINGIDLVAGRYIVAFETQGFTYGLPGNHVHFFWNTVPVAQAGVPGNGPWAVYGGPSPFQGYAASQRPGGATELCILVANPDHSVRPGTGNCYPLP
jgi:serine/threonine-protein kinase